MNSAVRSTSLAVILAAAFVQGITLFVLHVALKDQHWPATAGGWLVGLYAVAVFVPLTVQMLAEHARTRALWITATLLLVAFFYFGWHHGSRALEEPVSQLFTSGRFFPIGFVLLVLWLMLLPFIRWRLASGRWRAPYETLFASAWRNKLVLAEAALFTGLFWLLLMLWQALFGMLGIRFFRELFAAPWFIYPVTSLTFGVALHLIGSLDRLTNVVLEQLLSVLKWLAVIAGLILTLFTVALVFKLPRLVASDLPVIGAAWLLWLVAVVVLLLNAAYRDGSVARPYPGWIAFSLRLVVPLTVLISLTALYALYVRIDAYGFTVERVWASIVAASALAYSVGYSLSGWRRSEPGRWMAGMSNVNIGVAWALIGTIALTLTPLLSPYRISANSQYSMALRDPSDVTTPRVADSAFTYLRFSAGEYGLAKLRELSALQEHPRADGVRSAARAALERKTRWEPPPAPDATAVLADLAIYPAGRSLDDMLRAQIETDLRSPALARERFVMSDDVAGLFIDMNEDEIDEFMLISSSGARVYELTIEQQWQVVGIMYPTAGPGVNIETELADDDVRTQPREWRDLVVGERRFLFK